MRANSIFRKLDNQARLEAEALIEKAATDDQLRSKVLQTLEGETGTEVWSLVMLSERTEEVIAQCAASSEPANLAKYAFNLARAFNLFYHRHRIIAEEDTTKRAILIAAANIARRQLTKGLATLGISVPERM